MEIEIWKDIPFLNSQYQASSTGRIRSADWNIERCHSGSYVKKGRTLKKRISKSGYELVSISDNSNIRTWSVHRLIAITFIPNPENKRTVNHKNGIKSDNRIENLEWMNHSENHRHAFSIGLKNTEGVNSPNHKLNDEDILFIRRSDLKAKDVAKKFGVTTAHIYNIKRGINWKHLLIIFLLSPLLTQGQTVLLPTWVADSLIYETTKGRACANVMTAQQNEIEALGKELLHTGEALKLSQSESSTLENLLSNSKEQGRVDKMQADLNEKELKKKVRKRNLLILGESVVILILLLAI